MSDTRDLFEGVDADYGTWEPTLREARLLVRTVEGLADKTETYVRSCRRAERMARRLRAWSVARAVCWASLPEVFDGYGCYDHVHTRLDKIARRWLERLERRIMHRHWRQS